MDFYATRVKRDIRRWVEAGRIDAATGSALARDIDIHGGARISFGTVLSMMAACLFAAAILVFVAANWQDMPRLVRVAMLFVLIAGGYVGGAAARLRGAHALSEGAFVVAATAFGASIALIAQMYHLSGEETQALFIWCAGTTLAAVLLRSKALTVAAALLAGAWMHMAAFTSLAYPGNPPLAFLAIAIALYVISFWTQSGIARHVVLLSLYWFICLAYAISETFYAPLLLAAASIALFIFARQWRQEARRWLGLGSGLPVQALLGFLVGVGIMQLDLIDEPNFLLPTIAALAGIVAALVLEGRDNTTLRWLAYAAFVFQLCFVYLVMVGSMMGTAGFFVLGGLALSLLAWLIARLEQRFSGAHPSGEGVA